MKVSVIACPVCTIARVWSTRAAPRSISNLQSTAKDRPTVLFFPGAYTHSLATGASLDLFGRLHDDKYYRAFNIFHCEP